MRWNSFVTSPTEDYCNFSNTVAIVFYFESVLEMMSSCFVITQVCSLQRIQFDLVIWFWKAKIWSVISYEVALVDCNQLVYRATQHGARKHFPLLSAFFYRTRVRSLFTLVSNWLTDWLTHWLLFSTLDWCDPGMCRWQLKTCYCCWCWLCGSCWQQFVADLDAEVWS